MKTNWSDYEVFIKSVHLKGQSVTLTIVKATEEPTHPQQGKTVLSPVLWFRELPFGLILSPTNRHTLIELYGDSITDIIGKPIVVKAVKGNVAGRVTEPIRIQNVRPTAPSIEPATGELVSPQTEPTAAAEAIQPTSHQQPATSSQPVSEIDLFMGPSQIYVTNQLPINKAEFDAWLKAKTLNGKETRSALGTDAAGWLKLNPGKTYTDVAKTIAATLAK